MTAETCTNCDGLINEQLRPGLGIDWQCAWCGQAGTYQETVSTLGRVVIARMVTVKGDPAQHKPWVPAESMPYAQRVATGRAAP
jgi:hypothetical protein